jgi:MFS family permease
VVKVLGVGLFGLASAGFAAGSAGVLTLAPWFVAAEVAIGCVETAEHAAVASLATVELHGSAFGLLAAVQSFGNLAASAIAGLLWTVASPRVAFAYLVGWMLVALVGLLATARRRASLRRLRGDHGRAAPNPAGVRPLQVRPADHRRPAAPDVAILGLAGGAAHGEQRR